MENADSKKVTKHGRKIALKIAASLAGIWVGLLLILQLTLSPAILTDMVRKFANSYLDADLEFESIGD